MSGSASGSPTMGGKGGGQVVPGNNTQPIGAAPGATAPTYAPAPAPTYAQPAGQNVYGQAAGAYNQALAGPNVGQFFNPFQQQVVNNTMNDIGTAQQQAMGQLGAQATAANAYGGSRHGIAEGATNAAFIKQMGDTSANMNMQGWNSALGAAQGQQGMQSQLAGQGFGFGQQLGQQQQQQGLTQQAMMQQLIDAAKNQWAGYAGAPSNALTLPMAAVGGANMGQNSTTGTQTQQPGLFNYLSLGASLL